MDFNSIEEIRKKHPPRLTRGRAIKLYCKEVCCCGDLESWKNCPIIDCFLWEFRRGKEIIPEKVKSNKKTIASYQKEAKKDVLGEGRDGGIKSE